MFWFGIMQLHWQHKQVYVRDESGSTLESQEGPRPLHHDDDAILETNQVHNMHRHPGEPGKKTADLKWT